MSIVGSIHIQCGYVGKCGGHVFAVDARKYLDELTEAAIAGNGSYSYPIRYCPACLSIDTRRGHETAQQRDERIEARRLAQATHEAEKDVFNALVVHLTKKEESV
tara:strand:+ start:2516 stop:2830 length:315 start_codon:yes stop_codon:yes gene_type:complete